MAPRRSRLSPRFAATPNREPVETISLVTPSGQSLALEVREPRGRARATVVLAHAMLASRTSFGHAGRGGLAAFLADRGVRAVSFDFRGHGESGPLPAEGGDGGYDELVHEDLPAAVAAARAHFPRGALHVLGHSLGGTVAAAALGLGLLDVDGLVLVATDVWRRRDEASLGARAKKQAVVRAMRAITRARGHFPARALGLGSDDASARLVAAVARAFDESAWHSDDGRHDYAAAFGRARVPILAVASDGDAWQSPPDAAFRFAALAPTRLVTRERVRDGVTPAPGHGAIVTSAAPLEVWARIVDALCGPR